MSGKPTDGMVKAIRAVLKEIRVDRPYTCDWSERIDVKSGSLNVVFFHVNYAGKHPFLTDSGKLDYAAVLKSSVFAARKAGKCSVVVLTDESTEIPIAGVQVVRLPARSDQMMYTRMRAYRAVSQKLTGRALFLDTDVHLQRDFSPAFEGEFDVGLTYRTDPGHAAMLFNEGMILGKSGTGLASFWNQALNIYDVLADLPEVATQYGVDPRMWRGGQLSLAALLNWTRPSGPGDATLGGIRYRFLPCELWNYPVKSGDSRRALKDKWALHYKGAVKAVIT